MSEAIEITRDCSCDQDLHELRYPRPGLTVQEFKKGDVLPLQEEWSNLYGSYYRCKTKKGYADISTRNGIKSEVPLFHLRPELLIMSKFDGIASIEDFGKENSVFSASVPFAKQEGGAITKRILDSWDWDDPYLDDVDHKEKHIVIDTRVQRLMPGMYPSIPGWHLDAVPRETYESQPDLTQIDPMVKHYFGLISTCEEVSNTEFVVDNMYITINDTDPVYKQIHSAVEKEKPRTMMIAPGYIYRFNQQTIHRTMPTVNRGWRMFFRLSIYHNQPLNEKTGQQQVYLLSEENGW